MQKLEPARLAAVKERIAAELTTTFASAHAQRVSLAEALQLSVVRGLCEEGDGRKGVDHASVS